MDAYFGTIVAFGFNYAPRDWAMCQGQIVQISQNTALYSLLVTQFGGDGRTTFGLPNLMDRIAVGQDQVNYKVGQTGGSLTASLTISNMPAHAHVVGVSMPANNTTATGKSPVGTFPAVSTGTTNPYNMASQPSTYMAGSFPSVTLGANAGGTGASFSTQAPTQVLNYSICLYGIYPERQS